MTEHDDRIVPRLQVWFDGEVARAQAELAGPPTLGRVVAGGHVTPRVGNRRTPIGLALAVTLVVVAVGIASPLLAGHRLVSDGPDRSQTPVEPPIADGGLEPLVGADLGITGWYADGVPASIDGVAVLRPGTAEAAPPGSLVGGWVRSACAGSTTCRLSALGESPNHGAQVTWRFGSLPDRGTIAVVRVLDDEREIEAVWNADPSYMSDRSPDGIPRRLGHDVVHRADELLTALSDVPDGSTVLVGGWFRLSVGRCPGTSAGSTLEAACIRPQLLEGPGVADQEPDASPALTFVDVPWPSGAVVLRLHRGDPADVECVPLPTRGLRCDDPIVVDEVAWDGDEWTDTAPLTIEDVDSRLAAAGIELRYVPANDRAGRAVDLESCAADWPPQTWQAAWVALGSVGPARVGRIGVFATTADRERVQATLDDHGTSNRARSGLPCQLVYDSVGGSRWVGVDNVIVGVPFRWDEPTDAVQRRVEAISGAFRAR